MGSSEWEVHFEYDTLTLKNEELEYNYMHSSEHFNVDSEYSDIIRAIKNLIKRTNVEVFV